MMLSQEIKSKWDDYILKRNIKNIIIERPIREVYVYKIKFDIKERSFVVEPVDINIREKEGNNMLEILKIYEKKKIEELQEKYDEQLEELEANDPVTIIVKETEDNLKEILNTKNLKLIVNSDLVELTQETIDKRDEIIKIIRKEKQNLKTQISEIQALLELAPNYEEKMQILRDYGIIDKKKNIVL